MKLPSIIFWAFVFCSVSALAPANAGPVQLAQGSEHCETRCTLDHETCQSDVSDSIDECESSCDEKVCNHCQETMQAADLEKCNAQCDQCENQCDTSAEPRRQACDNKEQQCLTKCMEIQ